MTFSDGSSLWTPVNTGVAQSYFMKFSIFMGSILYFRDRSACVTVILPTALWFSKDVTVEM